MARPRQCLYIAQISYCLENCLNLQTRGVHVIILFEVGVGLTIV